MTGFKCNRCNNDLKTETIVGEAVRIENNNPHYPISIVLGCPNCGVIISNRLLITPLTDKKRRD